MTVRRSYIEVPTMDEGKWAKIPGMPADVVMADIEDSVPPSLKMGAREKVVGLIGDPSYFGGREFICRPNNLNTEWGLGDLEALAKAHVPFVLYPKVRSVEEMQEVNAIFAKHGATPEIQLIIETPQAVLHLEEIASVPNVTGLMFGPGDLSLETGISLLDGKDAFEDGFIYARSKLIMVARALGLEATEGVFLADLKDLDTVRRAIERSRLFGFNGNMTFYPPHIAVINDCRTPKAADVAWSKKALHEFGLARERGQAAVTVDGRWLTVHQVAEAEQMLRLAQALGIS